MSARITRALLVIACIAGLTSASHAQKLQALIIDGRNEHDWKTTTPILKQILESSGRFQVDVSTSPNRREPYGEWSPRFSTYDVVVSNFNDPELWPESVRNRFVEFVRGGGGFVAVHAANNSFGDWAEYTEMVGLGSRGAGDGDRLHFDNAGKLKRTPVGQGPGSGYGPQHEFVITVRKRQHPIVRGLPERWLHAHDELTHALRGPARNLTILATAFAASDKGGTGDHEPMMWVIPYGKGRVFSTMLGHSPFAMSCAGFVATLHRGAEWAATGQVTLPIPAALPRSDRVTTWPAPADSPIALAAANVPPAVASEPPVRTVRVAGIVLKWIRGSKQRNYERIESMIREAAAGGAKIIVTTECFLDGYAVRDKSIPIDSYRAMGERVPDGEYFRNLAGLARELRVYLALGLHEDAGKEHYNTAALIGPDGKLVGRYHKHRLGHEVDRHTPGTEFPTFKTEWGTVGMMICADRGRHFVWKGLCDNSADFLFCLSGGSFGPVKNDVGMQLLSGIYNKHTIFVHPAEFLVTGPQGSALALQMFGEPTQGPDALLVSKDEIDGPRDQKNVCYFDLPVGKPTKN